MLTEYRKNFSALVDATLLLLDDPEGERYADEDVKRAINDAMLEIALDAQLITEQIDVQLKANVPNVDIKERVKQGTVRPFAWPLRMTYNVATDPALPPFASEYLDRVGFQPTETGFRLNEAGGTLSSTGRSLSWRLDLLSHGEIGLYPTPAEDGEDLDDGFAGNLRCQYVAMPTEMSQDTDYPDTLQSMFHDALPVGAAARLLDEGDEADLMVARVFDAEFAGWKRRIVAEQYRGLTRYDECRPA